MKKNHVKKNTMRKNIWAYCLAALFLLGMSVSLAACGKGFGTDNKDSDKNAGAVSGQEEKASDEEIVPDEQTSWLLTREEHFVRDEPSGYKEYEYNEYGQITQKVSYDKNGAEIERRTYTYDENQVANGGTISLTEQATDYLKTTEGVYTYDAYGYEVSRHDIVTMDWNDGQPYEDSSAEYDTYYFRDAAGVSTGSVKLQEGQSGLYEPQVAGYYAKTTPNDEEVYNDAGLLTKAVHDGTMEEYEYDAHGNMTKKITTKNMDSPEKMYTISDVYTYEERLCKTAAPVDMPKTLEKEVIATAVARDTNGEMLYHYTYAYDPWGEITLAVGYKQGTSFAAEYNVYDEPRHLGKVRSDSFTVSMIYDESGRRIREEFRESIDGEPVIYADCEYDGQGNLLRTVKHAVSGDYAEVEGSYQEYEYENMLQKKCSSYAADGTLMEYEVYEYDEAGKVVSVTNYNGDGTVKAVTTPLYHTITVLE